MTEAKQKGCNALPNDSAQAGLAEVVLDELLQKHRELLPGPHHFVRGDEVDLTQPHAACEAAAFAAWGHTTRPR